MNDFLRSLPSPRLAALVRVASLYAPGRLPEVVSEAARRCPPTPRTVVVSFDGPAWREAAGVLPYSDERASGRRSQGLDDGGAEAWCRPRHLPREFFRVVRDRWMTVAAYSAPLAACIYLVFFR